MFCFYNFLILIKKNFFFYVVNIFVSVKFYLMGILLNGKLKVYFKKHMQVSKI